jgi:hypothetical protein
MRTTRWLAGTAVIAALVLAGCGDDASSGEAQPGPSGTSGPTTSTSSASSTPGPTTCPYITEEQVSAAVGAETVESAGTLHACFFDPASGHGPSVMLSRIDVQIDPVDYARQSRALCTSDVTDVDVGTEAFACVSGMGPQGQLYAGRVLVAVNINDAADDDAGVRAAATLLRDVTIPPQP